MGEIIVNIIGWVFLWGIGCLFVTMLSVMMFSVDGSSEGDWSLEIMWIGLILTVTVAIAVGIYESGGYLFANLK